MFLHLNAQVAQENPYFESLDKMVYWLVFCSIKQDFGTHSSAWKTSTQIRGNVCPKINFYVYIHLCKKTIFKKIFTLLNLRNPKHFVFMLCFMFSSFIISFDFIFFLSKQVSNLYLNINIVYAIFD